MQCASECLVYKKDCLGVYISELVRSSINLQTTTEEHMCRYEPDRVKVCVILSLSCLYFLPLQKRPSANYAIRNRPLQVYCKFDFI